MVLFLYVYARELTTVKFCYQEIRIKKNTTVFWCNKIREMMANFVLKEADVARAHTLLVLPVASAPCALPVSSRAEDVGQSLLCEYSKYKLT